MGETDCSLVISIPGNRSQRRYRCGTDCGMQLTSNVVELISVLLTLADPGFQGALYNHDMTR